MTTPQVVLGAEGRVHLEPTPPAAVESPTDVLLAPLHIGICGSDVHVLHGRHPFAQPPVVTGHEGVAHVLETGADAADDGGVGELVTSEYPVSDAAVAFAATEDPDQVEVVLTWPG